MPEIYGVTCVQAETHVVTGPADRDEVIRRNLDRAVELIEFCGLEARFDTKLVVFPEFFLTGVPESRTIEAYLLNSEPIPGPATAPLQNAAAKYGFYVAANTFEKNADWPGRCFNTSFLIDPRGEIILKYWKHNDAFAPVNTNTGDVYTRFVDLYGEDALFPVVDTDIGRLACITCYDICFPEVARCFALKGAEVLIMPTGEGHTFVRKQSLMRQARAYENSCYVVCANHGRFYGGPRPTFQQGGYTEIVDFNGDVVLRTEGPGEATLSGSIDLHALRAKRARIDLFNLLSVFRGELYAREYQRHPAWPLDAELDRPLQDNSEHFERARQTIQRLNLPGVRELAR